MEEYKKIFTVLKKINPEYPHKTILVLDATTGQNALNQVEEFKKISNLTGLIITKLDTSAKGGILLAICKKFGLPIIAVGMGEKETDLHQFNSADFSKMLLKIKNENIKKNRADYFRNISIDSHRSSCIFNFKNICRDMVNVFFWSNCFFSFCIT